MDSFITKKLKSNSIKIVNNIDKLLGIKVSTKNYITFSIFLNAFAILVLFNGEFKLFLMLFVTAFYIQFLGRTNKKLKNDVDSYIRFYGRFSVWLMLGTVFNSLMFIYDKEITLPITVIFFFVLTICNINYSLKILDKIEKKEFDDHEDFNSYFIKKWAKLYSNISKKNREKMSRIARHFDEQMIFVFFIILIIYINNKVKMN